MQDPQNKQIILRRTFARSYKYSVDRQRCNKSIDANHASLNFRIKKNSPSDAFQSIPNLSKKTSNTVHTKHHASKTIQPLNISYLQSFTTMISRQYLNEEDGNNIKDLKRIEKITIPSYNEQFDQNKLSHFTLLDVLNKPISSINNQLDKNHKEILRQKHQTQLIKGQLQNAKDTILYQLQEIDTSISSALNRFKEILNRNTIEQQQKKLRTKNQIFKLEKQFKGFSIKFHQMHLRNQKTQKLIFNCKPFELKYQDTCEGFSSYF